MAEYTADSDIVRRFMALFAGNERGFGYGRAGGQEKDYVNNKWKYKDRYIGWKWRTPGVQEFLDHLNGIQALGIGAILEDGTTKRGELDVDYYNLDYIEVMRKIEELKLPLVTARTKSGGLRLILLLKEAIDTRLVRDVLRRWAGMLGYSDPRKCEVYPKQDKLGSENDGPLWTFLPYGPTFGVFEEQYGMNGSGGALELPVFVSVCESKMVSREEFMKHTREGSRDKERIKKTKHTGSWVLNGEWSIQEVIDDIFIEGPTCLTTLSKKPLEVNRNIVLFNTAIFLKRKYPDNWPEPTRWLNTCWLTPSGDPEKLNDIIRRLKDKEYHYQCSTEPMHGHCHVFDCQTMKFGVGDGDKEKPVILELGISIVNTIPREFWLNAGSERVKFTAEELRNLNKFKTVCLANGVQFPVGLKQGEWEKMVVRAVDRAGVVEPSPVLKKHASEISILEMYFKTKIPNLVRAYGNDYLNGKVSSVDHKGSSTKNYDIHLVRVRVKEKRIYFKEEFFMSWFMQWSREISAKDMRSWLNAHCTYHTTGGISRWWRYTYSVLFEVFEEDVINRWLDPNISDADSIDEPEDE